MKGRILLAAAVATASLAGCASGSGSKSVAQATVRPTPSPSVTPSPTQTRLTVVEARATYLRLVKPINTDVTAANKIMTASAPSLTQLHRVARKGRVDVRRYAIALRTTLWPADALPVAQRYADSLAAEVLDWRALATDTASQANADWDTLVADTVKSAKLAEQMRERLGLPPAS